MRSGPQAKTLSNFMTIKLLTLFVSLFPVFHVNSRGIPYVSKMWEERKILIAEELAKGHYDIVSLQEVW